MSLKNSFQVIAAIAVLLGGCTAGSLVPNPLSRLPDSKAVTVPSPSPTPARTYTAQEWEADVARRKEAAPGLNAFGFQVFNALVSGAPTENVALSPTSLGRALLMAYIGARGYSRDAIATALGMPDQSADTLLDFVTASGPSLNTKGVKIQVADSAWLRSDFEVLASYRSEVEQTFGAEVNSFNGPDDGGVLIADWISRATGGFLKPAPIQISDDILFVLADVLFFDGRWAAVFDKAQTAPRTFFAQPATGAEVPTMHRVGLYQYGKAEGYEVVSLPYDQSVYSMWIAMASDSASPSLPLDAALFGKLVGQATNHYGDLYLPRFDFKVTMNLTSILKINGLEQPFSATADFSGLSAKAVQLMDASQLVRVAVDEEGTVAAAATLKMGGTTSAPPPPPPFRMEVNRPFYFVIRDDYAGTALFLGKVVKPGYAG